MVCFEQELQMYQMYKKSGPMKVPGACRDPEWMGMAFNPKLRKWRKKHMGAHDLMMVVAACGETLIWCRKCSGYSRYWLGDRLVHRCGLEAKGNKEHGRMKGRVPARRESKKRKRKSQRGNDLQDGGLMAQKGLWTLTDG